MIKMIIQVLIAVVLIIVDNKNHLNQRSIGICITKISTTYLPHQQG
ncbi:MAG: hypothetical protein JWO06_3191 [Bacteroidota bacterium]|nr:hypothetical protein [Bacteroidota bacterium]